MSASVAPLPKVRVHLVVGLLAAVLTGCGDSSPGLQPDTDPTLSGSPSRSQEVAPADGPIVANAHASYRVPKGFEVADELAGTIPANASGSSRSAITLGEFPAVGTTDLGTVAGVVASNVARGRPPRQMAQATLDGEPAFHLAGRVEPGQRFEAYGAVHDDTVVYVRFDLDGSRAATAAVIESVLATWQWK